MKHRILIIGENYSEIEEVYNEMGHVYEVMVSSPIEKDIDLHIKYFKPMMMILVLEGLHDYVIDEVADAKQTYQLVHDAPLGIIGHADDIAWFNSKAPGLADVELDINKSMVDIQMAIEVNVHHHLQKHGHGEHLNLDGREGKILVIDDSPLMLKIIREQLRDVYEVVIVNSGQLGLEYLASNTIDMVLLDYDMPEMSGLDVLKAIRDNPNTKHLPVVFLTGVSDRTRITKALAMEPQGYLLKPIDHDKLFSMIHKCIG